MRPPICAVCNKRFSEGGGLLQFSLTDTEKEKNKKFDDPGFAGHPSGLEWFCKDHYGEAKLRTHLTLAEALAELKKL